MRITQDHDSISFTITLGNAFIQSFMDLSPEVLLKYIQENEDYIEEDIITQLSQNAADVDDE